ncbi:hypothetical protein ABW20_dc0106836 [Dactylellina cionopaga]|nr:hypothetical protein ABW20_dc0106836 [Dactylellina cionopaga]
MFGPKVILLAFMAVSAMASAVPADENLEERNYYAPVCYPTTKWATKWRTTTKCETKYYTKWSKTYTKTNTKTVTKVNTKTNTLTKTSTRTNTKTNTSTKTTTITKAAITVTSTKPVTVTADASTVTVSTTITGPTTTTTVPGSTTTTTATTTTTSVSTSVTTSVTTTTTTTTGPGSVSTSIACFETGTKIACPGPVVPSTVGGYAAPTCYVDTIATPVLTPLPPNEYPETGFDIQACADACGNAYAGLQPKPPAYIGVEAGTKCLCGNALPAAATATIAACQKIACSGDPFSYCGDTNAALVYFNSQY